MSHSLENYIDFITVWLWFILPDLYMIIGHCHKQTILHANQNPEKQRRITQPSHLHNGLHVQINTPFITLWHLIMTNLKLDLALITDILGTHRILRCSPIDHIIPQDLSSIGYSDSSSNTASRYLESLGFKGPMASRTGPQRPIPSLPAPSVSTQLNILCLSSTTLLQQLCHANNHMNTTHSTLSSSY